MGRPAVRPGSVLLPAPDGHPGPDRQHQCDQGTGQWDRSGDRGQARQQDDDENDDADHGHRDRHTDRVVHASGPVPPSVQLQRNSDHPVRDECNEQNPDQAAAVDQRGVAVIPEPGRSRQTHDPGRAVPAGHGQPSGRTPDAGLDGAPAAPLPPGGLLARGCGRHCSPSARRDRRRRPICPCQSGDRVKSVGADHLGDRVSGAARSGAGGRR